MSRRTTTDDWDDDADGPDDDEPTVPCPYCKRLIHEDAQRCPHCESYISEEDRPASPRPWWIILGVLLGLYVVYRWIAP
jgi:hypothetical protein